MSDIMQGISLSDPNIRQIDMSSVKRVHLSEMADDSLFERYIDMQEKILESRYTTRPETANNPRYAEYASVNVDGEVVAQIDNHGFTNSANIFSSKIQAAIKEADAEYGGKSNGPELAHLRAEKIAEALGGTVNIANTALTQDEFAAVQKASPQIDYQALRKDPAYEMLQQTKRARTLYVAQDMGQNNTTLTAEASPSNISGTEKTAEDEFKEYMDMTPEERYLAALLSKYDLTKEEFDALPLEEQEKIMAEVKQDVIENVEDETGIDAGGMISAMQA